MQRNKYIHKRAHGILLLLLFVLVKIQAQTNKAETIMSKYAEALTSHKEYQVKMTYNVYKGFEANTPYESVSVHFYKNQGNTYSNMGEAEIISTTSNYLKINHTERAMLLSKPVGNTHQFDINLIELYKYLNVSLLKETNTFYRLEFKPKGLTQLPFSSLKIDIDKKTYLIRKQLFYYFSKMNFSTNFQKPDYDNYKLEIIYDKYRMSNFSVSKSTFDLKKYVENRKGKIVVAPKFKGYELIKI